MAGRRVVVTGSREWHDSAAIGRALDEQLLLVNARGQALLIAEGGATGADQHAAQWAANAAWREGPEILVQHVTFRADWDRFGRAAGPRRNEAMLRGFGHRADIVLAFRLPGRSPGTDNCVLQALRLGIPVQLHGAPVGGS